MGILCVLFGHRPAYGYGDIEGQGYFEVRLDAQDGINRQHARLFCNCERCGERYQVGMIHLPQDYVDAKDALRWALAHNVEVNYGKEYVAVSYYEGNHFWIAKGRSLEEAIGDAMRGRAKKAI